MSAYTVAVLSNEKLLCNGAIVHNEFIVTSASCVHGLKPSELIVRAGSENFSKGGVAAEVSKIVTHKKFNEFSHDYDLAVLRLKGCLATSTSNIKEISISSKHITKSEEGLLTGWVLQDVGAERLQIRKVNVHHHSECEQVLVEKLTKRMLCTDSVANICINFASGSPIVSNGTLIGIKSFGYPCIQRKQDIFTNISVLLKFVQKVIKKSD